MRAITFFPRIGFVNSPPPFADAEPPEVIPENEIERDKCNGGFGNFDLLKSVTYI
jgi:hypothetical protein